MSENKKSVNILVESDVWDNIEENKSKICREALRAHAEQTARGDVKKYTREYENAKEELREMETEVEVKRQMLHDEMEKWGYDQYILPDEHPDGMGTFEETIMFSSQYAETYLEAGQSKELVAHQIRQDMMEEGRQLSEGVSEWIVEKVEEQL